MINRHVLKFGILSVGLCEIIYGSIHEVLNVSPAMWSKYTLYKIKMDYIKLQSNEPLFIW